MDGALPLLPGGGGGGLFLGRTMTRVGDCSAMGAYHVALSKSI